MNRTVSAAVFVALAASSAAVMAAEQGGYIYGGVGQAQSDRKGEIDDALSVADSSADERDSAFKVAAGYRVNRHIALEAGYLNLGKVTYQATTLSRELEVDGWFVAGLMGAPITDNLSLYAKAGAYRYQADFSCAACVSPSRQVTGKPPFMGLGFEWNPTRGLFVRAEYEIYLKVGAKLDSTGSSGTTKSDVQLATIGAGYRF